MKRVTTILKWLLVAVVGFLALVVLLTFLLYPSDYVLRLLRWGDSDVYDYQRFPSRAVAASTTTYTFTDANDEDKIRSILEINSEIDDLDTFLVETGTQAFIVIQDDAILYERYFNGNSRDSIVTSFSMAKSFASALIGIAIAEGHIGSVHDPITTYLPELAERDPAFQRITIRDLLMMSSGIKYAEFPFVNGDDAKTYYYPDLRQLALTQTQINGEPGERFLYNNYHPLLLGLIIERATEEAVADYLAEKIWHPLGTEYDASWSLDSEETGFEKMESGINARAIDFAKFGRLFLQQGNWFGTQVIPAEWVADSTQADTSIDYGTYYPNSFIFKSGEGYYKYMWWGLSREDGNYDFAAEGNHGQTIFVSPQNQVIIVRNAEQYGIDPAEWLAIFQDLADHLGND